MPNRAEDSPSLALGGRRRSGWRVTGERAIGGDIATLPDGGDVG